MSRGGGCLAQLCGTVRRTAQNQAGRRTFVGLSLAPHFWAHSISFCAPAACRRVIHENTITVETRMFAGPHRPNGPPAALLHERRAVPFLARCPSRRQTDEAT